MRPPSQGAGIEVETESVDSTYSEHPNTEHNAMLSTIHENSNANTSSSTITIGGNVNVEELLSMIRTMKEEQKALKDEVEELKKQLAESTETGKTLEKKLEEIANAFDTA